MGFDFMYILITRNIWVLNQMETSHFRLTIIKFGIMKKKKIYII